MVDARIIAYVHDQLAKGVPPERVRKVLAEPMHELTERDIDEAFLAAGNPSEAPSEVTLSASTVTVAPRMVPPPLLAHPFAGGKVMSHEKAPPRPRRVSRVAVLFLIGGAIVVAVGVAVWSGALPYERVMELLRSYFVGGRGLGYE